jgi:hypothetical protein
MVGAAIMVGAGIMVGAAIIVAGAICTVSKTVGAAILADVLPGKKHLFDSVGPKFEHF